jgi:septum formation protein
VQRSIILASGSPRRKELLKEICKDFVVITSLFEETIFPGELPETLVKRLSMGKAEDVWDCTKGDRIVIGADTVVALDGEIMGKPFDATDARRMLKKLSGKIHQVYTGVAVLWDGGKDSFVNMSQVEFYPLSEEEIDAYIDSGEPFGKAGAYAIQLKGKLFVKSISGDYSNIVGFPVAEVYHRMSRLGLLPSPFPGKL